MADEGAQAIDVAGVGHAGLLVKVKALVIRLVKPLLAGRFHAESLVC
jgi:hypothetical protein